MLVGGFVIEDRLVTLADITCPVLTFVGEVDEIGQPAAVRGIRRAAPRADVYEATLPAGHFGLVVGSRAGARTWPAVAEWARWREGTATRPDTSRTIAVYEEAATDRLPGGPDRIAADSAPRSPARASGPLEVSSDSRRARCTAHAS